jgi:hypothetical protein
MIADTAAVGVVSRDTQVGLVVEHQGTTKMAIDYCEVCGLQDQKSDGAGDRRVRVTCERCGTFDWEPGASKPTPVTSERPISYRALAACCALMGRIDEARAIVGQLRAITPRVVPNDVPFRNPGDRELFLSGLRLAAGKAA